MVAHGFSGMLANRLCIDFKHAWKCAIQVGINFRFRSHPSTFMCSNSTPMCLQLINSHRTTSSSEQICDNLSFSWYECMLMLCVFVHCFKSRFVASEIYSSPHFLPLHTPSPRPWCLCCVWLGGGESMFLRTCLLSRWRRCIELSSKCASSCLSLRRC